ncbi:peptidoglycan amidohydrolase family protein [Weissella kandleri]|uniref:peptidoglycan amidohydrolase family protein n=1 Tax=Weissella kandleri TaxID=1616 RepID=UPI00387E30C5
MTVNNEKVVQWFINHEGILTYSMSGSRNGADGTADCSGSVTQAIYEAGGSEYGYLYSTVTLPGYLAINGYERICVNGTWDALEGDIVMMSGGASMAESAGAGGHVGVMMDDINFISTDWTTQGQAGTAVSINNINTYLTNAGMYYEIWRNTGVQPSTDNDSDAIKAFKQAGNQFTLYKPFKIDAVRFYKGIYQGISFEMAGITRVEDANWYNQGIPLAFVSRVDGGDNMNIEPGAMVKLDDGYNYGTIDQYDAESNGVFIVWNNAYGGTWFDADAVMNH